VHLVLSVFRVLRAQLERRATSVRRVLLAHRVLPEFKARKVFKVIRAIKAKSDYRVLRV
jgi:hypothetical protein